MHEAVSDPAPFQLPPARSASPGPPTSYYCVAGGIAGLVHAGVAGDQLARREAARAHERTLVINAVGDGSRVLPQVWSTAAHRELGVLYIVMNNREYRTLQVGLGQVVAAYGRARRVRVEPRTMSPSTCHPAADIESHPGSQAFGVLEGEVVTEPAAVAEAVRRGIDYVLRSSLTSWTSSTCFRTRSTCRLSRSRRRSRSGACRCGATGRATPARLLLP